MDCFLELFDQRGLTYRLFRSYVSYVSFNTFIISEKFTGRRELLHFDLSLKKFVVRTSEAYGHLCSFQFRVMFNGDMFFCLHDEFHDVILSLCLTVERNVIEDVGALSGRLCSGGQVACSAQQLRSATSNHGLRLKRHRPSLPPDSSLCNKGKKSLNEF